MNGPEYVGALLAARLAAALPAVLADLVDRLDLDPADLPLPAHVVDHEVGPLNLDDYPIVAVVPQAATGAHVAEPAGDPVWQVTYPVRVWHLVARPGGQGMIDDYAAIHLLRDRYTLAVREVLLGRLQLAAGARIARGSWAESYSSVQVSARLARTVAGSFVAFDVVAEETLTVAPLGVVETVGLTVTPLGA